MHWTKKAIPNSGTHSQGTLDEWVPSWVSASSCIGGRNELFPLVMLDITSLLAEGRWPMKGGSWWQLSEEIVDPSACMLSHFNQVGLGAMLWTRLWTNAMNQSTRLFCPWDSLGKNTGVDCHALLQGIFLTQGSNPHLLKLMHWQVGSLPLVPPQKPN